MAEPAWIDRPSLAQGGTLERVFVRSKHAAYIASKAQARCPDATSSEIQRVHMLQETRAGIIS